MTPFYIALCHDFKIPVDKTIENQCRAVNEQELTKMNDSLKDAQENLGETEISEALLKVANYKAKIGEKVSSAISSEPMGVADVLITDIALLNRRMLYKPLKQRFPRHLD